MGAVGRVDVDQDRADLGGGVLRDRPLRAVGRPHPDPVALRDAGADQPAGEGVHVAVELGVGPASAGGELDERLVVAVRRDGALEVGADGLLDQGGAGLTRCVGLHWSNLSTGGGSVDDDADRAKYAEISASSHCATPSAHRQRPEVRRGRPGVLDVVDPVGRGEQQHRRIVQHGRPRRGSRSDRVRRGADHRRCPRGRPPRAGRPPAGPGTSPARPRRRTAGR